MTFLEAPISMVATAKPAKEWLSRKEAAIYLGKLGCPISPGTLANLASNGNKRGGPPFTRFRWKTVQYRRADLEEWASKEAVRVA